MSSCPGEGTLRFLGTDALGDATYSAIEQHVEGCPECKAVLERLAHRHPGPTAVLPRPERWPRIPGFEIQSELGRGAMGVVYLAIDTGLDRLVALKILPGALSADESSGARRRWLREARAVASIRHPNVVPLHDYGEADGWFFLVLEYIPGGSLKQRLTGPLPPRVAAGLVETIARAVGCFHGRGLHHLDLKPSNILLDGEEDGPWDRVIPRVSDFGLALSDSDAGPSETSLAGIRGTPSYMAPEQATAFRADVGAAADIHALGAILYELLTGRPPFHGTSALETLDQVRGQRPVPPRRLNPKILRDLETIALKCLEKNPSRRYATAEALADDLDRFLDGRPIKARPVSPIEHAWRWCRRQPVIAALAATLFLTLIGSFLGLLALLRRTEAQRARSEANYQVASRSLDELVSVFSYEQYDIPVIHFKANRLTTLEVARSQVIELSKRYPLDMGSLKRLATIDNCLATSYLYDRKQDEALSIMEESIGYCEAYLALSPGDVEIQQQQLGSACWMVLTLSDSRNDQRYDQWNARTIAMLKRLKSPHKAHVGWITGLSDRHRRHADSLMFRGESDRARKELEDDLDLVRSLPVAETAFPEFALSEALTLAALGQGSGEFTPLRSPIHPQPANASFHDLGQGLAEMAARRICWRPSIVKPPWLIPEDLPTKTWTDRVISSIKSDASKFALDHTRIPAIGWVMRQHCASTMSWQRQVGKLGDAHRIADQLVALAERLTRSYSDQAAPYMLLSEGYVQKAKNAYREDEAPVIGWERKALDAAIHAATLEPGNDEARNLVRERHARVKKLESQQ
jgi:eukaryotic-like serine/threonine-protein kinase